MAILRKFLQFPYIIMRKLADANNNLHDFTQLHSSFWFMGLLVTAGISYLAWSADWEVLFGIEFNAHHNVNRAWWNATAAATLIQVLVLACGGIAVKVAINGLTKGAKQSGTIGREHAIQLTIYSLAFAIGMGATIYLSLKTDQSAKANAYVYAQALEQYQEQQTKSLANTQQAALKQLDSVQQAQKKALIALHDQAITLAGAAEANELQEKKGKLDNAPTWSAKKEIEASIQRSTSRKTAAEKTPTATKNKALFALDSIHRSEQAALKNKLEQHSQKQVNKFDALLMELQGDIQQNAEATKYRNVLYNVLGFIFTVGLYFFFRGANHQKNKNNTSTTPPNNNNPNNNNPDNNNPNKGGNNTGGNGSSSTTPSSSTGGNTTPNQATAEALEAQIRDAILNNDNLLAYELNQRLLQVQALLENDLANSQIPPLSNLANSASTDAHSVLAVSKLENDQNTALVSNTQILVSNAHSNQEEPLSSPLDANNTLEWTLTTDHSEPIHPEGNQKPELGQGQGAGEMILYLQSESIEAEYDDFKEEDMQFVWENGKPYVQYTKRNGATTRYDKSRISAQRSGAKKRLDDPDREPGAREHYMKRWQMWCNLHEQLNQLEEQAKEKALQSA